jgi:3-dehydroquinate dehydratase II
LRITVLNGVNLDVLGRRDPSLYGGISLEELESRIYGWGRELELIVQCRQTNYEGEYVKWCHDAAESADGVIVNPGAWTHYSYAIRDAIDLTGLPAVEVHLSEVDSREDWRRNSVIREVCIGHVQGKGVDGYRDALEMLKGAFES